MNEETLKELRERLGTYIIILPSIRRAEQVSPKLAFHITDDKKILKQKKFIEEKIDNLKIMKPIEWQTYVYHKLDKDEQAQVKDELEKALLKEANKNKL